MMFPLLSFFSSTTFPSESILFKCPLQYTSVTFFPGYESYTTVIWAVSLLGK